MLGTFVIGLREGVEAALIVGIVAAFLGRRGRSDLLRQMWLGIGLAVLLCLAVAVGLQVASAELPQAEQEGLETAVGALAVALVTTMIVWTRRHARRLRGELERSAALALAAGSAWALVGMAFLAVLREGFETAVFLLATFQASGSPGVAAAGAVLGILAAAAIGYGIYRGGVRLDLSRFFRVTGVALVVVAAGLLLTALHTAHEAGWLNAGQQPALDLSWLVQPGTVLSSVLTGVLGLQPHPTRIEVAGWLLYAIPVGLYVAWPPRRPRTPAPAALAVTLVAALLAAACGGGAGAGSRGSSTTLEVTLTNDGCRPARASVPAGPLTVHVANQGGDRVSEIELIRDGVILGEKENLAPGLSGSFSVDLAAGDYELACPGARTERAALKATGTAARPSASPELRRALDGASSAYEAYVRSQVDDLVTRTQAFVAAIHAGDVATARLRYATARAPYERIEPVAESFGDLDPAIDARAGGAGDPARWTGFHRLEKALWADGSVAGMAPVADRLLADVRSLQALVRGATFDPVKIANGSAELLDEVGQSKITGEEERYSRLDLLDMDANVGGSRQAFNAVQPALALLDAGLAKTIDERFTALDAALAKYRSGDGYVAYDRLGKRDTQALAKAVDDVAEPLSKVAGVVVQYGGGQ